MPRPKLNRERFNATLPPDLIQRIDAYAVGAGKTRSDILELAAADYLAKHDRPADGKATKGKAATKVK